MLSDRTYIILLAILFLLSINGLILHYRAHPFLVPDETNPEIRYFKFSFFLAFILSLIDVILVTLFYLFKNTIIYGYLLNGFLVIYGIAMMTHFSWFKITSLNLSLDFYNLYIFSTFPNSLTSLVDFLIGYLLYKKFRDFKI
ncbi:MAG: hypothetical protein RMJ67_09275 [Elusimicrobiota bacterium]|nr:hypothetical protein [Endomicrobiia bacterium]MDW8166687.1 hypothetical protein [Elusimicrobiota bacterium]